MLTQVLGENSVTTRVYGRYVDGINIVIKRSSYAESEENGKNIIEKIQHIANSLLHGIRDILDYPTRHPNKKLPFLGTEIWLETINKITNPPLKVHGTHILKICGP